MEQADSPIHQTFVVYSDVNIPKVMKIQTSFTKHYLQSSCCFTTPLNIILTFQFLKKENESNSIAVWSIV